MRLVIAIALSGMRICDGDGEATSEAASVEVTADPVAPRVAPAAKHGGSVTLAGDYSIEVLPQSDGKVFAYVADAQAAPVSANIELSAKVSTTGGALHPIVLVWNPANARFEGELSAGITPMAGPMEINVITQGITHTAQISVTPIIVVAQADIPAPRAQARARASARVAVEAPKVESGVSVRLNIPRPPTVEIRGGAGFSVGGGARLGGGTH